MSGNLNLLIENTKHIYYVLSSVPRALVALTMSARLKEAMATRVSLVQSSVLARLEFSGVSSFF